MTKLAVLVDPTSCAKHPARRMGRAKRYPSRNFRKPSSSRWWVQCTMIFGRCEQNQPSGMATAMSVNNKGAAVRRPNLASIDDFVGAGTEQIRSVRLAPTTDVGQAYSITSSANAISAFDGVTPSALADLRLTTKSNLVGL